MSKAKQNPGCAGQFTLRLALLVSLVVSHNKQPHTDSEEGINVGGGAKWAPHNYDI